MMKFCEKFMAFEISVLILVHFMLLAAGLNAQTDTVQTDVPALKDVYDDDFYIGCLLSYRNIGFPDDPYVPGQSTVVTPNGGYLIKFHMNSMSPGNNMKPQYTVDISGSAAAYNAAAPADKDSIDTHPIVRFNGDLIAQLNWAQRQGFTFRGHTLVWHNQTPTEFFRSGYTSSGSRLGKEKMTERLDNYLKEVIRLIHEGWPGLLSAMDVVNEAVNDDGSDRITSDWYLTFGDNSYLLKAFELTRKHSINYGETQIKLYYNDYNTHNPAKANGIVRICTPIYEAGYLDGIGMQDHDGLNYPTAEQWIASYDKFYPICDEIAVTELDVTTGYADPPPSVLATQANQYGQLFKGFVERSYFSGRGKVISVSKDGLNDQYTFKTNQASSLWDAQNQCKPAFYAVVDVGKYYNALDSLVAHADSLAESDYTAESWSEFFASLANVKNIMWQDYSAQESAAGALGEALSILESALASLVSIRELTAREPIIIEAESGIRGSEFDSLSTPDGLVQYIMITTDYNQTTGATDHPGTNRTVLYQVTFPDTGTYDLFVRLRVGPAGYNDDSFFYGKGFGIKDPEAPADWMMVNGLQQAGFSAPAAVVREAGGLGNGMWKWVNLSRNGYQSGNFMQFLVDMPDSLTRTFAIGARENGLDLDKFAFGRSELYYTVLNLDSAQAGSETDPTQLPEPLTPIALGKEKFLGNVYSSAQLPRFTEYWNQVTPENAGKWGSVEGSRDNMNWAALDAAYALAKSNGFQFRFHVLIWGNQQPAWIEILSAEEQLAEIEEWFAAVAARYPDIDYLEVVNEPLHDPPDGMGNGNYMNALGGSNNLYGTGWDWVIKAFELARQYFPDSTKLMINDYSIPNSDEATTQYLNIINHLLVRDLIDGIGIQGHAFSTRGSMTTISNNLDRLGATGLPIQVCEMDIDGPSDEIQLSDYQEIFPTFWTHPAVEGITLWGWRPGMWRTDQMAYLMTNDGVERPALIWLRDYVENYVNAIPDYGKTADGTITTFQLEPNYPNPFNPSTTIGYYLPRTAPVRLDVYDIRGRHIRTLVQTTQPAGRHEVFFNAENLSSGVYFYRLEAGASVRVRQMLLMK